MDLYFCIGSVWYYGALSQMKIILPGASAQDQSKRFVSMKTKRLFKEDYINVKEN